MNSYNVLLYNFIVGSALARIDAEDTSQAHQLRLLEQMQLDQAVMASIAASSGICFTWVISDYIYINPYILTQTHEED